VRVNVLKGSPRRDFVSMGRRNFSFQDRTTCHLYIKYNDQRYKLRIALDLLFREDDKQVGLMTSKRRWKLINGCTYACKWAARTSAKAMYLMITNHGDENLSFSEISAKHLACNNSTKVTKRNWGLYIAIYVRNPLLARSILHKHMFPNKTCALDSVILIDTFDALR
jgi:hypothetical protein